VASPALDPWDGGIFSFAPAATMQEFVDMRGARVDPLVRHRGGGAEREAGPNQGCMPPVLHRAVQAIPAGLALEPTLLDNRYCTLAGALHQSIIGVIEPGSALAPSRPVHWLFVCGAADVHTSGTNIFSYAAAIMPRVPHHVLVCMEHPFSAIGTKN
jgi:hypothetical protein